MNSLTTMRSTLTTTKKPLFSQTLTLISPNFSNHIRTFAKYTPFKPPPKPNHHQNLRTIKTLKTHLKDSQFIAPFPCHGFSANKFKPLKSAISKDPSSSKLVFVKNSLVSKAFKGTQFEVLGDSIKGMNCLLFVKDEGAVGPVLGSVKGAVKEGKLEFNEFNGGVVDGKLYGHLDLEVFEKCPSKVEMNGMLLGAVFGPSSTLMAVVEGFCGDESGGDGGGEGGSGGDGGESDVKGASSEIPAE